MAESIVPPSVPCGFVIAWKGKCGKPSANGRCIEHESKICVACGKPATHSCEYTGSSPFACGASLCDSCVHEPYNSETTPFPRGHCASRNM